MDDIKTEKEQSLLGIYVIIQGNHSSKLKNITVQKLIKIFQCNNNNNKDK